MLSLYKTHFYDLWLKYIGYFHFAFEKFCIAKIIELIEQHCLNQPSQLPHKILFELD